MKLITSLSHHWDAWSNCAGDQSCINNNITLCSGTVSQEQSTQQLLWRDEAESLLWRTNAGQRTVCKYTVAGDKPGKSLLHRVVIRHTSGCDIAIKI